MQLIPSKVCKKDQLKQKSDKAIGGFKTTIQTLSLTNGEYDKEILRLEDIIKKAQSEISEMKTQRAYNEKVVTKINDFLTAD